MNNISIFAKQAFINTNPSVPFISKKESYRGHGHIQRVSSIIRGNQIAEAIGAKLNPTGNVDNDICIYVKPHVKKGNTFEFKGKKRYLDIIDGYSLLSLAQKDRSLGIIACSESDMKVIEKEVPDNPLVLIPQHHCNFERQRRKNDSIKKVGVIGANPAFSYIPNIIKQGLAVRNIELIEFSKFFERQDIVDFYMNIDLQLVWRPYKKILSNPLKIVNAASFGIPTIALDEPAFKEMDGCYMSVTNKQEFFWSLDDLITIPNMYRRYSDDCYKKAEEYHISTISLLYTML